MTMKQRLDNQELDAIAGRLLEASRLTEAEIDDIAAAPGAFEAVLNRIRIAESRRGAKGPLTVFVVAHRMIMGTSLAAILCISALALILQQNGSGSVTKGINSQTDSSPIAQVAVRKAVHAEASAAGIAAIRLEVPTETPTVHNAIQKEFRRAQPRVEHARYSPNDEAHFVAVTYMGDGGESARGGRVVRVDVPRSTLFAMGFDVSLENDSPTVKADLLIGPDGVTRAVRLVE